MESFRRCGWNCEKGHDISQGVISKSPVCKLKIYSHEPYGTVTLWGVASGVIKRKSELPQGAINLARGGGSGTRRTECQNALVKHEKKKKKDLKCNLYGK